LISGTLFDVTGRSEAPVLIPNGRKRTAYRKMLFALGYLGVYMGLSPKISFHTSVTDWFLEQSLPHRFVISFELSDYHLKTKPHSPLVKHRIVILQIAGFVERSKYYGVWILTEGASILTGLGFTGYGPSGVPTWNGAANVDVWKIEVPENFKVLVDSWNIKTNVWLRECVYKRVTPKGKKAGFKSSMLTYLTSAIWVRPKPTDPSHHIDLTLTCAARFSVTAWRLGRLLFDVRIGQLRHDRGTPCPVDISPSCPPRRLTANWPQIC
jgi:lysophospholipid acyltransferase